MSASVRELCCEVCGALVFSVSWPRTIEIPGTVLCVLHADSHPDAEPGKALLSGTVLGWDDNSTVFDRMTASPGTVAPIAEA